MLNSVLIEGVITLVYIKGNFRHIKLLCNAESFTVTCPYIKYGEFKEGDCIRVVGTLSSTINASHIELKRPLTHYLKRKYI